MNIKELAESFKALGDETRVKIIDLLKTGKLCANEILEHFNLTQPTLSYHMKILTDCGLVSYQREKVRHYYTLNISMMQSLARFLDIFLRLNISEFKG
jgi:ArsR family transcriptional regulator